MKRFGWLCCASFVGLATVIAAPASHAGVDISFGMNAPVGDDGGLFFSISSRYFDRDARVVDTWGRRFPNSDDLAVFLYICSRSRLSPDAVYSYRRRGMSWYDVGRRAGLPVEVWYVPYDRDPGRRYSRAYGHWNQYRHDPRHVVRLSDREVRDLVAVRMAHEYYGVTPEVAMNWRRGGANVRTIMTREYRTRHRGDERPRDDRRNQHRDRRQDNHPDNHR